MCTHEVVFQRGGFGFRLLPLGGGVRQASKISRIEQGQATLKVAELDRLFGLFNPASDDAERISALAGEARKRGSFGKVSDWSRQYVGMETEADELMIWDAELVPGLVQTEEYARAIVSTSVVVAPADLDQTVRARMRRQSLVTRDDPPRLNIVLGEAALWREIGGTDVLRRQLEHLREVATLPHVTLQVLPFSSGEHAVVGTSFTLLRLDLEDLTFTYAYLEGLTQVGFAAAAVAVRDTEDRESGTLALSFDGWSDFLAGVKRGAFDPR